MSKIFGTDGVRCVVNQEPMTPDTCLRIAKAAGYLLSNKVSKKNRVIIAKDTRLSGYVFEPLITSGFVSMGMEVILLGPLPTPALAMLIGSLRADIGVMITASHNTYEYNGLKFFDSLGKKISTTLEKQIEEIVLNNKKYSKISSFHVKTGRAKRLEDGIGRYSESLKQALEKNTNFKGIKIVLDCANGATYKVAPSIFWELGCEVIAIGNQPNGKNINYKCGAVFTKQLSKKVLETNSDIGFAFDGDGDRVIVVDEKGKEVDGDKILALLTKNFLNLKYLKKKVIVSTVMSNLGFENYLKQKLGIKLKRTAVGDRNVINEMNKYNYMLGGEQSGHIIIGKYSKSGDGILSALKILEIFKKNSKKTSKLFDLYKSYPQEKNNLKLDEKINSKTKKNIEKIIIKQKKSNPTLRYLVRESGTEPILRILIEGLNLKKVKDEMNKLTQVIKKKLNEN